MTAPSLFPDLEPVDVTPPETAEKLSAGRRLTLRQRADVAAGRHPLMRGLKLREPAGQTCGSCIHRHLEGHHGRTYPKCDVRGSTSGPGTDCRAWWPACTAWEMR